MAIENKQVRDQISAVAEGVATTVAKETAAEHVTFTLQQRRQALNLDGPNCTRCNQHLNQFRSLLETRIGSSEMQTHVKIDQVVNAAIKGLRQNGNGTVGARQARMNNRLNDQEQCLKNVSSATRCLSFDCRHL